MYSHTHYYYHYYHDQYHYSYHYCYDYDYYYDYLPSNPAGFASRGSRVRRISLWHFPLYVLLLLILPYYIYLRYSIFLW